MNEKKILKTIINDCADGYGVFDLEELNQAVPKLTQKQLRTILKHLELNGFISIKYYDEKSYCMAPLQKARQLFEKNNKSQIIKHLFNFLIVFLASFIGSTIAVLMLK